MKLDINTLVGQLAAERDIEPEKLIDAIAEAISSAARKQYKDRGVHTEIDPETGEVDTWRIRMVVEEVEDPEVELTLEEGRAIDPEFMPWRSIGKLDDEELQGLWMYLQTTPIE